MRSAPSPASLSGLRRRAITACCAGLLLWTAAAFAQTENQDQKQGTRQETPQQTPQQTPQASPQATQQESPQQTANETDKEAYKKAQQGADSAASKEAPKASDRPTGDAAATPESAEAAPAASAAPVSIEFQPPKIAVMTPDWAAARAAAAALIPAAAEQTTSDPLARLNAAIAKFFATIADSPVPVLLPFDVASYLNDQNVPAETATPAPANAVGDKYLGGFAIAAFLPGPGGYDAVFTLPRDEASKMGLVYREPIAIQVSGLSAINQLDGAAITDEAVTPLTTEFPGIRRNLIDSEVRYSFERFGIPYVVSIQCHDTAKRARQLACREADQVAQRFLKSLSLAGGVPPNGAVSMKPVIGDRPEPSAPDFTFVAPGNLLPGTGMNGHTGRADPTVYARIRFPIAAAPAFVNSQAFMNWGNCDLTGRVSLGGRGKDAAYRCRVNNVPRVNDEAKNYAYPWRDNFCEHRYFPVGQCPAGFGHQGEDVRPGSCNMRNPDAGRCQPYQHDIVAVADGVVQRLPGAEALRIVIDRPGEHIRVRYLHMSPKLLDAAGLTDGRLVHEGDSLGPVGDYGQHEGGTSYHLHFDLQVATRHGWQYVNPYLTLVSAYERLIGARGRLIEDNLPASAAIADTPNVITPRAILGHRLRKAGTANHLSYGHRFFRLHHGRVNGRYSRV